MNLVCPPGSYDANVEPAKDDVLFTDSSHVLGLVESFFEGIYGELKSNDKVMTKGKRAIAEPRGFDLLLARKPQPAGVQSPGLTAQPKSFPTLASEQQLDEANVGIEESAKSNGNGEVHLGESDADRGSPRTLRNAEETLETTRVSPERSSNGTQPTWRRSMYPEEDDEQFANVEPATQSQPSEDDEDIRDVNVTNPWTLAKLSAPIHSRKPTEQRNGNQQLLTPAKTHDDLFEDLSSPLRFPRSTVNQSRPTPAKSQSGTTNDASAPDTFPYPMKAWGKAQREAHSSPHRASSEGQQSSSAVLENWVRRPAVQPTEELFLHEDDSNASRPRSDFVSASDLPLGTPLSAIPDISQKPRQKPGPRKQQRQSDIHKPFTPPVHDPQRVWFDHLKPSCTGPPKISQPRRRQDSLAANAPMNPTPELENDPISSSPPAIPTQHPGLALTMDYERRKADAVAARRALLRQQQPQAQSHVIPESSPAIKISPSQQSQQSSSSSPHQNRYRSALAALYAPQSPATDTTDVAAGNASLIDPKDPRAYLIRSNNPGKENRVRKTSLLPLETVSRTGQGRVVRELVQTIDIDLNALRSRIMMNTGCEYASETDDSTAFERVEDGEAEMWEERLKELVRGKYGEEEEGYGCLEIDVKGALEEDAAVAVALSV